MKATEPNQGDLPDNTMIPEHMDEGEQTKLQATCPLGDAAHISTMQLQRTVTM